MTSIRPKPSFEPLPIASCPPCAGCGLPQRAVLTDPDGLCEWCILRRYGIEPSDGQEWVLSWEEGKRTDRGVVEHYFPEDVDNFDFSDWSGYYMDYVGFVTPDDAEIDGILMTRKEKQLHLQLLRGYYDGCPVCVEITADPVAVFRVTFRMLDLSHFPTRQDMNRARKMVRFLLGVTYTRVGRNTRQTEAEQDSAFRDSIVASLRRYHELKRSSPRLSVAVIAEAHLGLSESTLRRYIREFSHLVDDDPRF